MIGNRKECIDYLLEQEDKTFEVKLYRKKRSNNANGYAWHLLNEMSNVLRASKDDIYVQMLKRYGQSEMVSVLSDIDVGGYFKYYEPIANTTLQGKEFTHYRVYKGSSEYDTREMSIFIDGIVSEAKELNIETMPESEIERLKELWK
jgi:hypothetical protein